MDRTAARRRHRSHSHPGASTQAEYRVTPVTSRQSRSVTPSAAIAEPRGRNRDPPCLDLVGGQHLVPQSQLGLSVVLTSPTGCSSRWTHLGPVPLDHVDHGVTEKHEPVRPYLTASAHLNQQITRQPGESEPGIGADPGLGPEPPGIHTAAADSQ